MTAVVLVAAACGLLSLPTEAGSRGGAGAQGQKAEVVKGAMGQRAWRLSPKDGRLEITITCDPRDRNYVTVRFWSEDRGSSLTLADKDGNNVGAIDRPSSGNIGPDQWYYSTRVLPADLTRGKRKLVLQLKYGGKKPSRPIYEISSHTTARFEPGDSVPETEEVEPYSYGAYEPPPKEEIQMDEWVEEKRKAAERTAEYIMSLQRYAPDWREKVESGEWPGPLVGGFAVRMKDTLEKSKNATAAHYVKRDNCGPLKGSVILAKAYTMSGGKYEGDPEVLDRVAAALDYMRRAQGANGGYVDVHGNNWVGGPSRGQGEGVLEGRLHKASAKAFMLVHEDLIEEGLLSKRIDDDADPDTPPIPRRRAYQDLFHNSLSYLLHQRGHAPNQELMNVRALAPLHRALQMLDGYSALGAEELQEKMEQRIEEITGLKPTDAHDEGDYWISPRGISMEIGGLSLSNYGVVTGNVGALADETGDERVSRRAKTVAEALSYFWYPVYHEDDRIDMRQQEAWSRRGINIRGGPISPSSWAVLNDVPSHIRAMQLKIMSGTRIGPLDPGNVEAITGYDPHGWHSSVNILDGAKDAQKYRRMFEKLRESDPPPLPHAKGQPDFAWVDPVAGALAVKHGDRHIFMTLKPLDGADTKYAGVLEVSPRSQRRALIDVATPHGIHKLTLLHYGPYYIAVNASDTKEYKVDIPGTDSRQATELVGRESIEPGTSRTLGPRESIVVHTGE